MCACHMRGHARSTHRWIATATKCSIDAQLYSCTHVHEYMQCSCTLLCSGACSTISLCVHVHATCTHAAETLAHAAHGPPCRVLVSENHSHSIPTCMHSKWCLRVHTFSPTARLSVMSMHRAYEAPAQARSQHGVACTGAQKSARALHIFMHICA